MSHSCINYIGKNAFPQNCQGDGSDQGDGSAGLIAGRVPAAFSYTLPASPVYTSIHADFALRKGGVYFDETHDKAYRLNQQ